MAGRQRGLVGVRLWIALSLLFACTTDDGPKGPGKVGPAARLVAADMDSDGRDELVVIHNSRATWKNHILELTGKVHAVTRGDIGTDGKEEAIIATGAGKGFPSAAATVWALKSDGPELLWESRIGRNRIADIRVHDGEVFLSFFPAGKTVVGAWIKDGALRRVTQAQMGMQQVPLGNGAIAVGRLYGEKPKSDGDLRILREGQDEQLLPTLRGIRSLASADLDQDGHTDLIAADGWHYKYGTHARARLVLYRGPSFKDRRILADFPDDYTVNRIEVVPATQTHPPRLLATGTQNVYLLQADKMGWTSRKLSAITDRDRAVVWSESKHRYVIITGAEAQVIALDE